MANAIQSPNRTGNVTHRDDIARAMYVGTKEVFLRNLEEVRKQWQDIVTVVASKHKEESYDSIGNMASAKEKEEGASIEYSNIEQAYETKLQNITYAAGIAFTMETVEDETWGVVAKVRGPELARSMNAKKETECAKIWDETTTQTGADGVPYASHEHPLKNNASLFNDNLVEGEFNIDTYEQACQLFNVWKNHVGEHFDTTPDKIIANRARQTQIRAMFESQLKPFEESNTKNTIPVLSAVFNTYIDAKKVHLVDTSIHSAILQERSPLKTSMEYDSTGTLNYYFAAYERYKTGMINPGFGFVTITGEAAVGA